MGSVNTCLPHVAFVKKITKWEEKPSRFWNSNFAGFCDIVLKNVRAPIRTLSYEVRRPPAGHATPATENSLIIAATSVQQSVPWSRTHQFGIDAAENTQVCKIRVAPWLSAVWSPSANLLNLLWSLFLWQPYATLSLWDGKALHIKRELLILSFFTPHAFFLCFFFRNIYYVCVHTCSGGRNFTQVKAILLHGSSVLSHMLQ